MSRVLCVEPDSMLAKQYAKSLASSDDIDEVVLAHDAQSALERLDESVDCVVLELLLGQHNGLELIYEMRSHTDLRDIPVVLVTDISEHVLRESMSYDLLGVYSYLHKSSMRLQRLQDVVEQAVEHRQTTRTQSQHGEQL